MCYACFLVFIMIIHRFFLFLLKVSILAGVDHREYVQVFRYDKSKKPVAILYSQNNINDLNHLLGSGSDPSTILGIDKVNYIVSKKWSFYDQIKFIFEEEYIFTLQNFLQYFRHLISGESLFLTCSCTLKILIVIT